MKDLKLQILNIFEDHSRLKKILQYCYEDRLRLIYYTFEEYHNFVKFLENENIEDENSINPNIIYELNTIVSNIENWNLFNINNIIESIDKIFNRYNYSFEKQYYKYINEYGGESKFKNFINNKVEIKIDKWKGKVKKRNFKFISVKDSKIDAFSETSRNIDMTTSTGVKFIKDSRYYYPKEDEVVNKSKKKGPKTFDQTKQNLQIPDYDNELLTMYLSTLKIEQKYHNVIRNLWNLVYYFIQNSRNNNSNIYKSYLIKLLDYSIPILQINTIANNLDNSNFPDNKVINFYKEFFGKGFDYYKGISNVDISVYNKISNNFNTLSLITLNNKQIFNLKKEIIKKLKNLNIKINDNILNNMKKINNIIYKDLNINENDAIEINYAIEISNKINKINLYDNILIDSMHINIAKYLFNID